LSPPFTSNSHAAAGCTARLIAPTQLLPGGERVLSAYASGWKETLPMDAKAEKIALFRYGLIAPL